MERIWRGVEGLYRSGVHPAIQLCLRREGRVVLDRAIGHARPNVPVTTGTPFLIYSAAKAVTAMVAHLLDQRGDIHFGDRVAEYLPEYGSHGKHRTVGRLLSHRAGVPNLPPEALDLDLIDDSDTILGLLCDARPSTRPGKLLSYHAISGGYVIAELVRLTPNCPTCGRSCAASASRRPRWSAGRRGAANRSAATSRAGNCPCSGAEGPNACPSDMLAGAAHAVSAATVAGSHALSEVVAHPTPGPSALLVGRREVSKRLLLPPVGPSSRAPPIRPRAARRRRTALRRSWS